MLCSSDVRDRGARRRGPRGAGLAVAGRGLSGAAAAVAGRGVLHQATGFGQGSATGLPLQA